MRQFYLFGLGALVDVLGAEPGPEDPQIVEDFAHQEVEKRPQLVEVILKRSSYKYDCLNIKF
jgi:hypothetical protein